MPAGRERVGGLTQMKKYKMSLKELQTKKLITVLIKRNQLCRFEVHNCIKKGIIEHGYML